MRKLEEIEKLFIKYLSEKKDINYEKSLDIYSALSDEFRFDSKKYRDFLNNTYKLNKLIYNFENPELQTESYRYHELILLFRHLSYSYAINSLKVSGGKKSFLSGLKRKILRKNKVVDTRYFLNKLKLSDEDIVISNWNSGMAYSHKKLAEYIITKNPELNTVVDYGSGLGYISYNLGLLKKNIKFFLVDLDTMVQDFAFYRFKKQGLDVEKIIVNEKNSCYPELPYHDLCIATEVLEHVEFPMKVMLNINDKINKGGLLFGNISDHQEEEQHISCDLSDVRKFLENNYLCHSEMLWEKM